MDINQKIIENRIKILEERITRIDNKNEQLSFPLDIQSQKLIKDLCVFKNKARAYRTGNQIIATGTWTKVQLNTESYDLNAEFDSTTNYRYTAKVEGYYLACGAAQLDSIDDTVQCSWAIYKNGTIATRAFIAGAATTVISVPLSDIIYLNAGNYLELYAWHATGLDEVISGNSEKTFLAIHRLS